jgi:micrococcal nuclease
VVPRGVLVALAVATAASATGWWLGVHHDDAVPVARVVDVLDGDTVLVRLRDGSTDIVRLLGVDTPETHHPTRPVECFGPEAAAYTARRLAGRVVRLEGDIESRDLYGRRLAYVVLAERLFNEELLREGYARLLVLAPNRRHGLDLLDAELAARRAGRGLWRDCEPR